MPTLRIPVSDELHHELTELKGRFKADDWPTLMQCFVTEARWADFARPLMNKILEWAQSDPPQETELLRKLGFVFMENVDGKGHTGIVYPTDLSILILRSP